MHHRHLQHTILVRNVLVTFTKNVINEDKFGVTCVGHAVIADEDDVNYIGKITCLDLVVQVSRKGIDLLQDFLFMHIPRQRATSSHL